MSDHSDDNPWRNGEVQSDPSDLESINEENNDDAEAGLSNVIDRLNEGPAAHHEPMFSSTELTDSVDVELNDEDTTNFLALMIRNRQISARLMNTYADFIDDSQNMLYTDLDVEPAAGVRHRTESDSQDYSDDESTIDSSTTADCDPYSHSYLSGPFSNYISRPLFSDESELTLPILVLSDVTLVPTQVIPLQFFLPNLITAMKELLDGTRTFGVIRSHLQVTGTTAEVISSQLSDSRGIEVLRIKAVGRQRFIIIGRQGDELLTDGLSTVSYLARVRILSDVYRLPYKTIMFNAASTLTCPCARQRYNKIITKKPTGLQDYCLNCQVRGQTFPSYVLDRYDENYLCARIILQLEKLCSATPERNSFQPISEKEADELDSFSRMTASLAARMNMWWPMESLVGRLSLEVARTSGPLPFIYWLLRNVPIGSQLDTWSVLHKHELGVERLTEVWNMLNAHSDVLYCEQCGLQITSLRYLFSMCRRTIRRGEQFASEYPSREASVGHRDEDKVSSMAKISMEGSGGGLESPEETSLESSCGGTTSDSPANDDDKDFITIPGDLSVIFVNSYGSVHESVSFRHAINFRTEGVATSEFSWYHGYKWTTIMCRRCFAHLGWKFTKIKGRQINSFIAGRNGGETAQGMPTTEIKEQSHPSSRIPPVPNPWKEDLKKPDKFYGLTRASLTRDAQSTRPRPWRTFLYEGDGVL